MEINDLMQRLRKLIHDEIYHHNRKHVHAAEIQKIIQEVIDDMVISYDNQRASVSELLSIYDENVDHVLGMLVSMFLKDLTVIKGLKVESLDLTFWSEPFDIDSITDDFLAFFEKQLSLIREIRLSNDLFIEIDAAAAGRFLRLIHKMISSIGVEKKSDGDDAVSILMQLWIARNIARAIDRKEIFYFLTSVFLDTLHVQQNYQFARDVAEECLICSYKDRMPAFGYYLSFKVFGATASSVTALHYAIVANKLFIKGGLMSDYLLKNYYWESIKFFRNISLVPFAVSLFEDRPTNVTYSSYELNKFFHAYFSTLLYAKDKKLPQEILNYIEKNRELIVSSREHEVLPWLTMLFNVKKNYTSDEFDEILLEQYLSLFKRIVSEDNYNRFYNSLFGSVSDLMTELKESMISLTFTRDPGDFVTDNKVALQISHRNILASYKEECVEAFLLSMVLQSDFSIVFKDKEVKLISPVYENYVRKDFDKEYYTPEFLKQFIEAEGLSEVLWLGADNNNILPLYYKKGGFEFLKDKSRLLIDASLFLRNRIGQLSLNTRTSGRHAYEKLYEDYKLEEDKLRQDLSFFSLNIDPVTTLVVIKDIELSSFPHNLITSQRDFISNIVPVANILSLEWFVENYKDEIIKNPSTSIWIPVESRDISVEMVYSKLADYIKSFRMKEYKQMIPESPLNTDINIVVAHGNEKINTFPALYLSDSINNISIRKFDYIIGKGKVLILFVCHSGSERSDLFRNQTLTVVKQFLQNGYKAVIAPFWALHIDIPPIWLPEFLNSFSVGDDIGQALFKANRKVAERFNTPNAYACLHLYGNPFVKTT